MSNQIAIKLLTQPLDEIICDKIAHIYLYEVGGYAFHSACSIRYLEGERGILTAEDIIKNINPKDIMKPSTKLVSLENTCNRGGGNIHPFKSILQIKKVCTENNLNLHLDGSRLFNALVVSNDDAKQYGNVFDTITICLSKGLGCPVGALLISTKEKIEKARRLRKVFGGGMRQSGILAAAGIFALENNVSRLKDDHINAQKLNDTLLALPYVVNVLSVITNIVLFKLDASINDKNFIAFLALNQIKAFAIGDNWVRFVTHLDITDEMVEYTNNILKIYTK